MMQDGFGAKLRELRQEKGMTLRSLAEAAGVDFTYLSKIENDRLDYSPGVETIRDLAQALGVDAMELLQLANKLPLDPRSPAIQYRNPGNDEERYGALSLCKLMLSSEDARVETKRRVSSSR